MAQARSRKSHKRSLSLRRHKPRAKFRRSIARSIARPASVLPTSEYLTRVGCARLLGVGRDTLERLMREAGLPCVNMAAKGTRRRWLRFNREAVLSWFAAWTRKAEPPASADNEIPPGPTELQQVIERIEANMSRETAEASLPS